MKIELETKAHQTRLSSIDWFKGIAILAVVIIHSHTIIPEEYTLPNSSIEYDSIIKLICGFAVPFFFITSGFFLRKGLLSGKNNIESLFKLRLLKLVEIWIPWYIFYIIFPPDWNSILPRQGLKEMLSYSLRSFLGNLADNPIGLIILGPPHGLHLWFISCMMFAIATLFIFLKLRLDYLVLPLSIVGYSWVVIKGAYINGSNGVEPYHYLLVSIMFVGLGWYLAGLKNCPISTVNSILLTILSLASLYFENYFSYTFFGTGIGHGYLFSTAFYGLGIFLTAWSIPEFGQRSIFSVFGKYTLGIYLLHPFLVGPLHGVLKRLPLFEWSSIHFLVVYSLTFLIILALVQIKWFRKFLV